MLKASQLVLVFEGAVDYVPQLQNLYTGGPVGLGLRFDGPGTNLSGNPHIGSYPQYPGLVRVGRTGSRPPGPTATSRRRAWSTPISSRR